MALVNSEKKTQQNMKRKAFRSKPLEICKTRTKKFTPDKFNFRKSVACQGMVTDAGNCSTCTRKFKDP